MDKAHLDVWSKSWLKSVSTLNLFPTGALKTIERTSYWSKPLDGNFSAPLTPERTDISPNPADRRKEVVTTTLVGKEEHQPSPSGDEEQAAVKGPDSSLFSASSSSSSSSSSHYIDAIVDKHQGNLSTEIQLILQRESIHLSLPQTPHSTSRGDGQCTLPPCKLVSQFSQYVSFYNPRPPVHEYVGSLQDGIDSLLKELHDCWLSQARPPDSSDPSGRSSTDKGLASNVDAFVSSIRECSDVEAPRSSSTQSAGPLRPHPPDNDSPARPPHAVPSAPPSQPAQSTETDSSDRLNAGNASSPPTTTLCSLISQIQPELLSNLSEIVQNVEKNSVQFYVHATEPEDSVYEEIKVAALVLCTSSVCISNVSDCGCIEGVSSSSVDQCRPLVAKWYNSTNLLFAGAPVEAGQRAPESSGLPTARER